MRGMRMRWLPNIPLTIRQRVPDINVTSPDGWDALRATPGAFHLADTREQLDRNAFTEPFTSRAAAIADILDSFAPTTVASYGVGTGHVELNLAAIRPQWHLICTDTAPAATQRLARLFPEADVRLRPLTDGPVEADVHLMYRVDTELTDKAWRQVLARFAAVPVLFVPGGPLEWAVIRDQWRHRKTTVPGGWLRTSARLSGLFPARPQQIDAAGMPAWLYTPITSRPATSER